MARIVGDSKTYSLRLDVTLTNANPTYGGGKGLGSVEVDAASISTIAKVFDTKSAALVGWSFKKALEGVQHLVAEGAELKGWDYKQLYGAMKVIGSTPYQVRGKAAARGNDAHDVLERLAGGEVVEDVEKHVHMKLADDVKGYALAVIDWWKKNKPQTLLCEEQVYGLWPRPYAGTLDFVGSREGLPGQASVARVVLTDLKTSKDVFPEHILQVTGYEEGLKQSWPFLPPRDDHSILLAREDGTWNEIFIPMVPDAWEAAVAGWYATELLGSVLSKEKS